VGFQLFFILDRDPSLVVSHGPLWIPTPFLVFLSIFATFCSFKSTYFQKAHEFFLDLSELSLTLTVSSLFFPRMFLRDVLPHGGCSSGQLFRLPPSLTLLKGLFAFAVH